MRNGRNIASDTHVIERRNDILDKYVNGGHVVLTVVAVAVALEGWKAGKLESKGHTCLVVWQGYLKTAVSKAVG